MDINFIYYSMIGLIFVMIIMGIIIHGLIEVLFDVQSSTKQNNDDIHSLSDSLGFAFKLIYDSGDEDVKKWIQKNFPYIDFER